ncbi:probable serine/threonine-protein kinase clkA isoform X1 [Stomoxys calcitrans]|nr:probable serine/threonine-protein kinase clkA isoform X1 [Stomoxys calcitrans]
MPNNGNQNSNQDFEKKVNTLSQNALKKYLDEYFSSGAKGSSNETPSQNFDNSDQRYGNDFPYSTLRYNANDGYDNSMSGNYKQSYSSFSRADNKQDFNAWNKKNGGIGNSRRQDDYDMSDGRPMCSQQRFRTGYDRSENMPDSGTKEQFHDHECSSWYGSSQQLNEKYDYSTVENTPKSRNNQNRFEEVNSARGKSDFNFQRNQVGYSRGDHTYDFKDNQDPAEVGNFNVTTRDESYNKSNQQRFAGDDFSRYQQTSDVSYKNQQNFGGGGSFANFNLQNNQRNISQGRAGGDCNNFYSNQQTQQFVSNKQNNLDNNMETNWIKPQSSHQMNRNDFGGNSNYQAPHSAVNQTRTLQHNSDRKIGSSTKGGSWQKGNDINKNISKKKNLDKNRTVRRRSAQVRDTEYQEQLINGTGKKAQNTKTKPNPESYWRDWWPNYAYIQNMIPIVDENDPEVKDFLKFTYEPDDPRFKPRVALLLNMGTLKILRSFNHTETNYKFRETYKLFLYKKHLEDPNFQKHLNHQEKDLVLKSLALLRHKGKYTLMLQSVISRWDLHQKTIAGLSKLVAEKTAYNMMNTKLYHYLVMDSIQELKNMCALDWSGFPEFYAKLQSMPPPHYASTDNILTKTTGPLDDCCNNSDVDNAD